MTPSDPPHFEPSPSGEITAIPEEHHEKEHNWKAVRVLVGEKLQAPLTRVRSASEKLGEWIQSLWPASADESSVSA